jgi:hypothetical protein
MTCTRLAVVALAAALLAGCGGSGSSSGKKPGKGPFPVQRPDHPPAQQGGGTPVTPVQPDRHSGSVTDTTQKPPVKPPDPPPTPASGAKKGVEPGNDAPELVLEDSEGKVFMLSSFRGKQPVLVVFGATW